MDVNEISSLISSVGFPILMSLLMYRFSSQTLEDVKEALNNNTMVLERLSERIENMEKKEE